MNDEDHSGLARRILKLTQVLETQTILMQTEKAQVGAIQDTHETEVTTGIYTGAVRRCTIGKLTIASSPHAYSQASSRCLAI